MIQVSPRISRMQTVPPTDGTTDHGKQLYRPRFSCADTSLTTTSIKRSGFRLLAALPAQTNSGFNARKEMVWTPEPSQSEMIYIFL